MNLLAKFLYNSETVTQTTTLRFLWQQSEIKFIKDLEVDGANSRQKKDKTLDLLAEKLTAYMYKLQIISCTEIF